MAGPGSSGRMHAMWQDAQVSGPYVERSRADWAELAHATPLTLDAPTLDRLRGLSDPTRLIDVSEVYLPLTRLLNSYVTHTGDLHRATNDFLRLSVGRTRVSKATYLALPCGSARLITSASCKTT